MALQLKSILLVAILFLACHPAVASIRISFNESAPKDWFEITNMGTCTVEYMQFQIDLSNTAGKLIFDTTAKGQGVEVFQPFEVREGNIELTSSTSVGDGETSLSISISNLAAGNSASFTIDVDDTLTDSDLGMIRVSNAEILGGELKLQISGVQTTATGHFDNQGSSILPSPACS